MLTQVPEPHADQPSGADHPLGDRQHQQEGQAQPAGASLKELQRPGVLARHDPNKNHETESEAVAEHTVSDDEPATLGWTRLAPAGGHG